MKTKNYALIGKNISHSISPLIHKELFNFSNINATYTIIDMANSSLDYEFNKQLKYLDGFNITIPYKLDIIDYLNKLDNTSKLYKSVNTVSNTENSLTGYNTDGYGFRKALELCKIPIKGDVVIMGNGGVARAIAYSCALEGANVILASREKSLYKSIALKEEIESQFKECRVSVCTYLLLEHITIDLLVNGTPVGMYPNVENSPVSENVLKKCNYVFDTIYNPIETNLLKMAKDNVINYSNGLYMLILQAAKAHKIWNNTKFTDEQIKAIYDKCVIEPENKFK